MLQTQSPISKFILLTYQEPSFIKNLSLKEKVENLIDLIKIKTQTRGINYTSQAIQNELFDTRIELLNFLLEQPDIFKDFEQKILEEIANKYYITGANKKLGETVADSLEVYFKMFSNFSTLISENVTKDSFASSEVPSLNGLKHLLSLQPSRDVENYISWLTASLDFDYALIVSDLVFNEAIVLKDSQTVQLESFVNKTIIDFGAYSVLTNFWQPEVEDEVQLIRNIKIKAATLELENGKSLSISSEALHQFITT